MGSPAWLLKGNAGTSSTTDFVGTTDGQSLIIKTSGTERIRVDANGKVGIGILDPAGQLSLGNYNSIRQLIWDGDLNNTQDVNCGFGINLAGTGSSLDIFMSHLYGLNIVAPTGPWPYPGYSALVTVLPNGNVGIGTTAPAFPLQIGTSGSPSGFTFDASNQVIATGFGDGGNLTLGVTNAGAGKTSGGSIFLGGSARGDSLVDAIALSTAGSERLRITPSGNVGIGTATPAASARLTVSFQDADLVSADAASVIGQLTNGGIGPTTSAGVIGQVTNVLLTGANTQTAGVRGINDEGHGVQGRSGSHVGTEGTSNSGTAVYGETQSGVGIWGVANSGPWAGLFEGSVLVTGSLLKPGGGFRIDHPANPANKYLNHSFVESSEMKNVYDGIATMDAGGEAIVALPEWFEQLNHEFRYQLSAIGAPAPQLHVSEEIARGSFGIAGGAAGQRISWQVTGIRKDGWAQAHSFAVEEEKPDVERGYYLHPELFGQPKGRKVIAARFPKMQKP